MIRSLVLAAVAAGVAGGAYAAGDARQLRFDWRNPSAEASCSLTESGRAMKTVRYIGTVQRQDMGMVCTVEMPRRKFDATYKQCAIDYTDSEPREHFACWLLYTPRDVIFLYSYSDDPVAPPPCAFACTTR